MWYDIFTSRGTSEFKLGFRCNNRFGSFWCDGRWGNEESYEKDVPLSTLRTTIQLRIYRYILVVYCIQYTVAYTGIPPSTTTATRLLASSFRMILHSELPAFFLHWHRVTSYRNLISVYTRILLSLGFHFDSITWLSSGLRSTCASLKCYSRRSTSLLFSFSRVRFLASMMSSR